MIRKYKKRMRTEMVIQGITGVVTVNSGDFLCGICVHEVVDGMEANRVKHCMKFLILGI